MEEDIKIRPEFVCFTDRKRLEEIFKEYCETNNIPQSLFNLITFLQTKKFLNEENIKNFLKEK